MNKTLQSVGIKYGLIVAATIVATSLLVFTGIRESSTVMKVLSGIFVGAMAIAKFALIARSHYEFNQKNGGYISFNDAISIGLIVIGIGQAVALCFTIINYTFVMTDEMRALMGSGGISILAIVGPALLAIVVDVVILFVLIMFEAQWKIFKKAGKEGWAAFVPIYNTIVLLEIVNKPAGWFFLLCIPGVNIIFGIMIADLLAKRFGKDSGFTVGMIFLPFVFYPMLGLSRLEMGPAQR